MEKEYEFLLKHAPQNIESIHSTVISQIDETRKSIIKCHRTVILSRILFEKDKSIFGDYIPDQLHLPSFILKPKEVSAPIVSPQIFQQSAHFFDFLHKNPTDLFAALMMVNNNAQFNYLIYSALPALFGYFGSKEHTYIAFSFYFLVFDLKSSEMAFKIAYPFLSAPYVFRFFESSLRPFFSRFLRDSRVEPFRNINANSKKIPKKHLNELSKIYASDMVELFISNLHLLPQLFIILFKIGSNKWGEKVISNFLFSHFLKDISFKFLVNYGYSSYEYFLENVFLHVSEEIKINFAKKLVQTKSFNEVPELFWNFGHEFIKFYICIQDVIALTELIKLKLKLPISLQIASYENTPKSCMFWIEIFPKRAIPPTSIIHKQLIFQNDQYPVLKNQTFERCYGQISKKLEECRKIDFNDPLFMHQIFSNFTFKDESTKKEFENYIILKQLNELNQKAMAFEDFLKYKLNLFLASEWLTISYEHQRLMIMPIAIMAVQMARRREYTTIDIAFQHASNLFGYSIIIQQDQFLSLINLYRSDLTRSFQKEFKLLKQEWSKFITERSTNMDQIDIGLNTQSESAIFWESVEELRSINFVDIPASFNCLMKSMKYLAYLVDSGKCQNDISEKLLVLAQNKKLLNFYVLINAFAMQNDTFHSLCSVEQEKYWITIESFILKMITSYQNIPLRDLLFSVQEKANNSKLLSNN